MTYAIIDVETTGMGVAGNKITEIAILIHDGRTVIRRYQSLVNPESKIPYAISRLTGIYDHMVADAPKFYEIAKEVQELLEGKVFVAHNVSFDYNVIRKEYQDLGFNFVRKKLCTVRLSRKLIPGLPSYSLGKLCKQLNIPIYDRHRAMGDAEATTILFEKLLALDLSGSAFDSFLKPRSREATLPPGMKLENFERIPNATGIYYFKNAKGEVIYVGKAIDIKKRVLSHFYDRKNRELKMCQETTEVDFKVTGSEMVALLMESAEIKRIFPKYNRAQRRVSEGYGLFAYEDRLGILHLAWNKLQYVSDPLGKFYNVTQCRNFLERLCATYDLCPKFCNLQSGPGACFHFQLKQCKGICCQDEAIKTYNDRVKMAIDEMKGDASSYVLKDVGRELGEESFVLVDQGVYMGFGFKEKNQEDEDFTAYKKQLIAQQDNRDIQRILMSCQGKNHYEKRAF